MPARAKLPPGEGKRTPLNMRTTRELRERLEREAAASGRSLAQQVEFRLDQSYASFGREDIFLVARLLATAIQTIEAVTGKIWMDDAEAHRHTQEACRTILDAFRPPGIDATESSTIGADAATDAVLSVFNQGTKAARLRKKKGG